MIKILKWTFCIILFIIAMLLFGIVWLFSFKSEEYSEVLTDIAMSLEEYAKK